MIKICIDAGHGGSDSGAINKQAGLKEKDLTLAVALRLKNLLVKDGRFAVVMTREVDTSCRGLEPSSSIELRTRAQIANEFGAHLMISIHFNAFNSSAHGVEALDKDGQDVGRKVAQAFVNILAQEEGLSNRGVKATNRTFAVIREANCPAIITESAFIDNTKDIARFDEAAEWDNLAMYHYRAICAGFDLTPSTTSQPTQQAPQKQFYRLFVNGKQTGAYGVKENALNAGWQAYNDVSKDVVMLTPEGYKYTFDLHQDENPNVTKDTKTPIVGKSVKDAIEMAEFVKQFNPSFDERIAQAYLFIGAKYLIRGDVAFAQAIVETGWFKFGGGTAVTPDQFNYCGLGVTSKGVKGASFSSIVEGVTAHIQHLFAYATKDTLPINEIIIDPRFKYVERGVAPSWEDLNNRWAMNPKYSESILSVYSKLMDFKVDEVKIAIQTLKDKGVIADPTYWLENTQEGKAPDGKWVGQLIVNMANKLK